MQTPLWDTSISAILTVSPGKEIDESFSRDTKRFLKYLNVALRENAPLSLGNRIVNFVWQVLEIIDFNGPEATLISPRQSIPFCGVNNSETLLDLCLLNMLGLILVVIKAVDVMTGPDPEAQVVGEAIAAFQINNKKREDTASVS